MKGAKVRGRIVSWEGSSLWIFEVEPGGADFPRTDFHSHHALQVTLALRGQFDLYSKERALRAATCAAVAADSPHVFHQKRGTAVHLFIAPESRAGRAIARAFFVDGSLRSLPGRLLGDFPAQLAAAFARGDRADSKLIEIGRGLVAHLSQQPAGEALDGRVERVIAWAARRMDEPATLDEAARHVGLSRGRLRHLFVAQTGLPFRVFVLWLRLNRAVELFAAGSSLTDSAHAAGFSDSAHFSRTFRRMFGIAAASLRVA